MVTTRSNRKRNLSAPLVERKRKKMGNTDLGAAVREFDEEDLFADSDDEEDLFADSEQGAAAMDDEAELFAEFEDEAGESKKTAEEATRTDESTGEHNECSSQASTAVDQVMGQDELVDIVLSFLGARELLNFSIASKKLLQCLSYDRVIRSAVMSGGNAKKNVERLAALIERRQIWTPSPLRLLRLANGTRCERCNEASVSLVSATFGVLYCFGFDCGGASWGKHIGITKVVHANAKWRPYVLHDRVAGRKCPNGGSIWVQPTFDSADDSCGPYATKIRMEQLMVEARCTVGAPHKALLEKYLDGMIADDPYASHAARIVATVKSCQEESNLRERQKQERKAEASRRAREMKEQRDHASAKANATRKSMTVAMLQRLSALIDEDAPWKDALWRYEWVQYRDGLKTIAKFVSPVVDEQLHPLALAPSKATKKKLAEVVATLKERFGLIFSVGFHDGSFLSDSDPLERGLRGFYQTNSGIYMLCNTETVELIRQSKQWSRLVDALNQLIPFYVRTVAVQVIARAERDSSSTSKIGRAQDLWDARRLDNKEEAVAECLAACKAAFLRSCRAASGLVDSDDDDDDDSISRNASPNDASLFDESSSEEDGIMARPWHRKSGALFSDDSEDDSEADANSRE